MNMSKNRWLLAAICTVLFATPARAIISDATLTTDLIDGETVGTTSTTVVIQLTAVTNIEVLIYRLENISDVPSVENQVAGIQKKGVNGTVNVPWDALWLIGNDVGRQDGNYQVIVTADDGAETFTVRTLLRITSVDIHNVSVRVSTDTAGNPSLPYHISYDLAKASKVTVKILNSSGTVVRTLLDNISQLGEDLQTNRLIWNGLGDDGKPVPLGIYTVTIDAKDSNSSDVAIQRTRTVAVFSLASLGSSLNELFKDNVFVYPNPIRDGHATFKILPVRNHANLSLKIYTLAGDLVFEEQFLDVATGDTKTLEWNADNESGEPLGRGVYYYVVRQEDPEGTLQAVKKLAIIR